MFARALAIALVLLVAGCEKTTHDNLDKWLSTEKGPGKIRAALSDEDLAVDLSAHAGVNLIAKMQPSMEKDAAQALEAMSPGRRAQVVGAMAPKLWEVSRVENDANYPSGGPQVMAKDGLVMLRKFADEATRAQIDKYLLDWYAVESYEKRATVGTMSGPVVMRMIGPPAGKRLQNVLDAIISAPPDPQTKKLKQIGDELLRGLAVSGNPESVGRILQVIKLNRGDETLPERAAEHLYEAYIKPGDQAFEVQKPDALVPNLPTLVALAKDTAVQGKVADVMIDLISQTGPANCAKPLVGMVAAPHEAKFKYVITNAALRCTGAKGIVEVVSALPDSGAYWHDDITGSVSGEIAKMTPRDQVLGQLRELLGSKSTVSRWVAMEALLAMKSKEDAPKIEALKGVKDKLVGYWGEVNPENKPDPSLGERAKQIATALSSG